MHQTPVLGGSSPWFLALPLLLAASGNVSAQRVTTLRVTVIDSVALPIADADVFIVRSLNAVVASGRTDQAGIASVSVAHARGDHQLVVRKIGFKRADRFLVLGDSSSARVRIVLQRVPVELPTVSVSGQQDARRRSYHIDADEIMTSDRPIDDALDILTKLRPDMLFSRMGRRMASAQIPPCLIQDVWVNGRRVVFPPVTDMDRARRMTPAPVDVIATLRTIHPEHVAEISYADCFDTSVEKPHAQNAVFVVLKPGVDFAAGRGSFVLDRAIGSDPVAVDRRVRLLGVFDDDTGDPIEGAAVTDSLSGTTAFTTATGTVTLAFLPDGFSRVCVAKPGYPDVWLDVVQSPRDTLPITLTVKRRP